MDKAKMCKILTSLANECWWIGTRDRVTKTGKAIIVRRINQLSKALGHGKLTDEEIGKIACYTGIQ